MKFFGGQFITETTNKKFEVEFGWILQQKMAARISITFSFEFLYDLDVREGKDVMELHDGTFDDLCWEKLGCIHSQ